MCATKSNAKRRVKMNETKETNKWVCVSAYFVFFIPLLMDSSNSTYRFHANQGLVLTILAIVVNIVGSFVPVIGWVVLLLGRILVLVLAIMGIVNAANENMKELPLIGKIELIK